jgi:hypothetical protein
MKFFQMKLFFAALAFAIFSFVAVPLGARAETVQAPTDTSAAGELAFWNGIKASTNAGDFEIYLKAFPDGMFMDVANARYKELGGTAMVTATPEPEAVTEEPPVQAVAEPPPIPKKLMGISTPRKHANSIFGKPKKVKQILVYRKAHAKAKTYKQKTAVVQYRKPKPAKYIKVDYRKSKPIFKAKKKYAPANEPLSGAGGGGGGGGGNGGGGGGGSSGGGGGWGG